MNGLLRAGCTVLVERADGGGETFAGFEFPGICETHSRPLWIALCEGIAKEPFHFEKMGVSDAIEPTLFICKT
jgi:hypothetical protein